jgi:adenosine deaminase CECR1
VIGFDLVGQEDLGRPLLDFVPTFVGSGATHSTTHGSAGVINGSVKSNGRSEASGGTTGPPTTPFYFHAGETVTIGGPSDLNLVDALLLNTSRIGHGYALEHHPLLRAEVKARGVGVEVCPLSNQVLMLAGEHNIFPFRFLSPTVKTLCLTVSLLFGARSTVDVLLVVRTVYLTTRGVRDNSRCT